jgi:hypothetical protein
METKIKKTSLNYSYWTFLNKYKLLCFAHTLFVTIGVLVIPLLCAQDSRLSLTDMLIITIVSGGIAFGFSFFHVRAVLNYDRLHPDNE